MSKKETDDCEIIVTAERIVPAKPEDVYHAAKTNQQNFPQYMTDVEEVKILTFGQDDKDRPWSISSWVTSIDGTPFLWTEMDTFHGFVNDRYLITWVLAEGYDSDLDKFEGEWEFLPHEQGSLVKLTVRLDMGIPHLIELMKPTLEKKILENSVMLLEGLERLILNQPIEAKTQIEVSEIDTRLSKEIMLQ